MISAAEAYKTAILNSNIDKVCDEIEQCIIRAASNGCYSCVYPGDASSLVIHRLIDSGYDVETKFSGGAWFTLISWGI